MKVSELIEILKLLPQDLGVYIESVGSDYDYISLEPNEINITKSELVDEDSDNEPEKIDICVIGVEL